MINILYYIMLIITNLKIFKKNVQLIIKSDILINVRGEENDK